MKSTKQFFIPLSKLHSNWFVVLFMLPCVIACEKKNEVVNNKSNAIARAYDQVLTQEELSEVIPNGTLEDSVIMADRYITSWLKEQAVLHQAKVNLPAEKIQFERELEDFRKSLITYAYEKQFIEERLDTLIDPEEVVEYYQVNKSIFRLKDYIVKTKYCILDSSVTKLKKFEKLFNSDDPESLVGLEQYCVDQGFKYYLEVEEWKYFEDLLREVPLEVYNIEGFLKKNKTVSFERDNQRYYVAILEYEFQNGYSPIELVEDQIKDLILNRRKQEVLSDMRDDLYRSAIAKKEIEKLVE
ncbi:MAG: hypothetical protein ACPGED_02815 [Flavobacteriales bacterium]